MVAAAIVIARLAVTTEAQVEVVAATAVAQDQARQVHLLAQAARVVVAVRILTQKARKSARELNKVFNSERVTRNRIKDN